MYFTKNKEQIFKTNKSKDILFDNDIAQKNKKAKAKVVEEVMTYTTQISFFA